MATQRFGAYEILHELKSGGMGSVLLARRRGPGAFEQLVAIKTIRSEYAESPAVRAMFLDEAAILARLNHPGIATVHDFGEEAGTLYMVMEYVAGIRFRDLLAHGPPPTVIARAILEACRGLHAAHELRDLSGNPLDLVHRDISPDNLMLGFDGHVKVIDFGIALVNKDRQAPVTELGTIKGKPPYMSPEQVANERMDRRSDVFSLGVVLWEMLAQRHLFEGDSIYHVAIAVQQQPIVPPSEVCSLALPAGLDAIVMTALERDLARRIPTAAAFAERLERLIQSAGGETLEAWADRVLAAPRDEHRQWLASIVEGGAQLPRAIGRPTGQMTEVGAGAARAKSLVGHLAVAPVVATGNRDVPVPPSKTSIGGTEDEAGLSIPPRSRLAPIVVVLLALLAGSGALYLVLARRTAAPLVHDADIEMAIDAATVAADADEPRDAELVAADAEALADAGTLSVRTDAGPRIVRSDAGRPASRDAGTRPVAAKDADVVAPPRGTGIVNIRFKPGLYANISIDGGTPVPGPLLRKKLAAGRHTITFHDPKSGETLDTQVVDLADGQTSDVTQR